MPIVATNADTQPEPLDLLAPHTEIAAGIVTITPGLAEELLRRNTRNRTVYQRIVDNYARDIGTTRWAVNGEAIKIATNGDVLDGQHRLLAAIKASQPLHTLAVVGLPPETQETMDTGRKRTIADALSLRGEGNAVTLGATLRRVWAWERGDRKYTGRGGATNAECTELLERVPSLRRSAEIAVRTRNAFPHIPPSVLGCCHYLFSQIDADAAVWFFQRIADGAELPAGHPVLALRARVTSERLDHVRMSEDRHMEYLIRAWNAVREDRSLDRLIHRPGADMPVPK